VGAAAGSVDARVYHADACAAKTYRGQPTRAGLRRAAVPTALQIHQLDS
jgi:hypothetical protein